MVEESWSPFTFGSDFAGSEKEEAVRNSSGLLDSSSFHALIEDLAKVAAELNSAALEEKVSWMKGAFRSENNKCFRSDLRSTSEIVNLAPQLCFEFWNSALRSIQFSESKAILRNCGITRILSSDGAASTPSLENRSLLEHEGGGGKDDGYSWWNKVLDVKEAKDQVLFSLPMIITNVSYYFIPLVSVMFAGHLGDLELAASNLANSWATVTGLAFMIGLSGALETLCGQGYGAQLYRMLGIYLQASCIISVFFSIIISIIWIFTEPILLLLHQDPHISKKAASYLRFLIPGLFAYGFLHNILRFLQTQSIVMPLVVCSVFPLVIHIGIAYVLVHLTALGFEGAALAASISLWLSVIMLGFYVLFAKKFNQTWKGFSLESFRHVVSNLKLALPSAAMVCLEYWAFELLVLLAGLMKNAEITTSLIAMCVNTEAIAYMFTYGLSAAASTRVSNELGAGNANAAKHAMVVTLKLSILLALVIVLSLLFGHDAWAGLFSDSPVIIEKFGSMTPFLMVSIIFDSFQGVLSGVARGCGWQHWAVCINLAMFYLIGMPIAAVLGFKLNLNAKGLWIGLICGLACQAGGLLLLTRFGKWTRMKLSKDQTQERPVVV